LTLTAFTIVCIALVLIEEFSAFWLADENWARAKALEEGEEGKNCNLDYSRYPKNHI